MSSEEDITFHIFFNGKFETDEVGRVSYEGRETHILEAPAMSLFACLGSELGLSLYAQRIWYKMPFENLSELKVLCSGEDSFERMCNSAIWTRCVDVYMEHENILNEDTNNVEESMENEEAIREDEATDFVCEEEARVEAIVRECYDDEDENNAYRDTPPQSDCEEEELDTPYERWVRGSGELRIRQLFESVIEFKEAVIEYALKGGWNIQFTRWGKIKSEAVCGVEKGDKKCPWRIYCSYDEGTGHWMVKTFQEEHTCMKDGRCRILSDSHIARLFLNDVRNDPLYGPKTMQTQIEQRYEIIASYDQCRKAKKKALDMLQAEYDEEYRRIKDYEQEINENGVERIQGKFTPKVTKTINLEEKEKKWCRTYPGPTGMFEVVEKGTAYKVNMRTKSCTCRRWDLTGIPCRHALRVGMDKTAYKTDEMVSDCYLTTTWQKQYSDSIRPLNGRKFWSETRDLTVEAPPRDVSKGRKKKPQQRIKGVNESPTKGKKVTQHGRVIRCQRCGVPGHNSLKCRNAGVPFKPRPPKKPKRSDEVTLDLGEGPSQTQPSTQE